MGLRAREFLTKARADLAEMETSSVQARVTVSMCDDNGVPRMKNRFFVVSARVARQVQMGATKQDRSEPHADFSTWNFEKGRMAGRRSFRMRLQHPDIEQAYSLSCLCYRAPNAPKPPGKTPYCRSNDMTVATRWDGKAFASIPCMAGKCPLRAEQGEGAARAKPAKTRFVWVGRLDEDSFPALLVSVSTGSDYNLAQWMGMIEGLEKQWRAMCEKAGVELELSWYGLPIRQTIYESTGDNSRFPRIHYTLDCNLEEVFLANLELRRRVQDGVLTLSAANTPFALPPASTLVEGEEHVALDADEVLFPVPEESAPSSGAKPTSRAEAELERLRPRVAEKVQQATSTKDQTREQDPYIPILLAAKPAELEGHWKTIFTEVPDVAKVRAYAKTLLKRSGDLFQNARRDETKVAITNLVYMVEESLAGVLDEAEAIPLLERCGWKRAEPTLEPMDERNPDEEF